MVMKTVQKAKGAEAIKSRKLGKKYRLKNKHKLNKAAKQKYKLMKPAEKLKFHARQIFTKAMRHGATEAEAKKVVMAWKKRRKHRDTGSHAAGQKREVTAAQRQIREQIRKKSLGLQAAHQKALSKIRAAKVAPAKRAAMRQAEKSSYANARKTLAGERTKAAAGHKQAMSKIKAKGKFSLKSLISNYKAKPISSQGKRLVDIGAKAAKEGVAQIAAKHFGNKKPAAKKPAGGVTKKAPKAPAAKPAAAAPAASPAAEKRKPGRPKKVAAAPAAAPAAEAKPKRAYNKKPKPEAAAPVAEKRKPGRPKKVAAAAPAAAPAAEKRKPGRPKKVAAEAAKPAAKAPAKKPTKTAAAKKPAAAAPAAEKRKPGRPKKVTEAAAPVAEKRKPGRPKKVAAEAAKPAKEKAASKKPAAKPAKEKAAAKAPAKKPTKAAAAKPAKEKAAAKPAAKPAKKTGGAVPKAKFG